MTEAADELEAIRQLKARYCRFLDSKDVESWRGVVTTDLVITPDMAVSTSGADPDDRAAAGRRPQLRSCGAGRPGERGHHAPAIRESHTPEITLTSATTASGTWRWEDRSIVKRSGEDG
jgi:hypothetical protein